MRNGDKTKVEPGRDLQELVLKRTASLTKEIKRLKRDLNKLQLAEEVLHDHEEKYRIHFSLSDDVMFSYDNRFTVLSVSPNVERLLGYKPEELVGKRFQELGVLHPDYLEEALDNALHVLSGKVVTSSIYEFVAKDGTRKFGEVSGVPLVRGGRVVEVITVGRDITGHIRKEKTLREGMETLRALLNASLNSLILLDSAGIVLDLNRVAAERLRKSAAEVLGTSIFDHLPDDVRKRRRIYFEEVVGSGRPVRFVDERRGKSFCLSLHPVHDVQGKVAGVAVYAQDLAEPRRKATHKHVPGGK